MAIRNRLRKFSISTVASGQGVNRLITMTAIALKRIAASALATTAAVFAVSTPAAASPDTSAPSVPVLLTVFGYECLEINLSASRATDNTTPQLSIMYEVYADGVLVGDIADRVNPYRPRPFVHGAAYVNAPGTVTVTVKSVDLAGNRSGASNAITTETTVGPC
jgi:hypothetical protein